MLEQSSTENYGIAPIPVMIKDLKASSPVHGWLLVSNAQQKTTTAGRSYLQFTLCDPTGSEITARQFGVTVKASEPPGSGNIVLIAGQAELFQGRLYLKLTSVRADPSAPIELFANGPRRPIPELEEDFWKLVQEINDAGLSQLVYACFKPATMERFRCWPASMKNHGAVIGGLLEHTINVATFAEQFSRHYPCQRDLVLAGVLLHDIGKLEELAEQLHAGYTEAGKLFGHIVLGVQYVQREAAQIAELESALLRDLLHIILAHHGTKEFGSPVTPATLEALIVHQADAAEARITSFLEHCQHAGPGSDWTSYHPGFGGELRIPG